MEMKGAAKKFIGLATVVLLLATFVARAQPAKHYTIKNGRMYIQLPRAIAAPALDSFIVQFDLADLGLKSFLKHAVADTLLKMGWTIERNNETGFVISKALEPFDGLGKVDDKIFFQNRPDPLFPAQPGNAALGVNRFRNKASFYRGDSLVRFFLRNQQNAQSVMLAGSFNNWKPDGLAMRRTDSGWICDLKLGPGKHWYKFVVDGVWTTDKDNTLAENDGLGNINSVFFRPNASFSLPGFAGAKRVYLAGSFNNWRPAELAMQKTADGWELPVYLAEGTHAYKFVADGRWYTDEAAPEKIDDGQGGFNAVRRVGRSHVFRLDGYANAKKVAVAGSFNDWRKFEWFLAKTPTGWELPYALGPGNYEYKFVVDGTWISDPANAMSSPASGNSYLVINPNYTFRLAGHANAKAVYLSGDFNHWDPQAYAMKRNGDAWVFPVHLSAGKHLYKFVVDGVWIADPANKLWEQNEHGTGNSVLWIGQ